MNVLSYNDVECYLRDKQVFSRKDIVNSDFKTIIPEFKVSNFSRVESYRINDDTVVLYIESDGGIATIYHEMTDLEFFSWIKNSFIPVADLYAYWSSF